jgi:phytoene synthase
VGLMMAKILQVKDRASLYGAIDLGIAMQLTNIARDVNEDKKNGRYYIKHNFNEIKKIIFKAELFYESAFVSCKKIPLRSRLAILVARRIYRQIGQKILNKKNIFNYDKSGKIYVNNFEKILQTIFSLFDLFLLFFKTKTHHYMKSEYNLINTKIKLNERI